MGLRWMIYCHTHIETGRRYVGLTKLTMMARWNQHVNNAAKKVGKGCRHFWNAIRAYGKNAFSHEVLEVCTDLDVANVAEECWIEFYDTTNSAKGFNLMRGGGHTPHPIKNPWERPEYRARVMAKLPEATRNSMTEERRSFLSSLRKGKSTSPEVKAKLSASAQRNSDLIAAFNRSRGYEYFVRLSSLGHAKLREKPQRDFKVCGIHGVLALDECYLFTMKSGRVKRYCKKCSIRKRSERKRRNKV